MSNIYISEPHTSGKVVLNTTNGEIEIELWAKEAPMACRNFIQLCMEGYYDHTIFHRVVKKFIIQGGDPTGTGDGGESIFGQPFKTEIHTRLRFNRRGLLAMSCSNNKVDGSQFFFTLKEAPELQGNHTIIGSVVGKTIYNMINLAEGLIDKETERPLYPKEVISATVISNPFDDIVPRVKTIDNDDNVLKSQMTAVNDQALLTFGNESDEDDDDNIPIFNSKGKSAHDYSKHSNFSKEVVQVDPNDEIIGAERLELAPVIIEKPIKKQENKERINQLREEARSLQDEIVTNILKDRAAETVDNTQGNKDEEDLQSLKANKLKMDQLLVLKKFSEKIKASTTNDWFSTPLTAGENDEVERKVCDPDVYNPEKYDLFDPRNPLNQRKRQADEPVVLVRPKNRKK